MSPRKNSVIARAAKGSAPTWIGTCSAWAISLPSRSQMAVEKSRLELRICEYEVRSIASPISSTIASRRCWMTETMTGSTRFGTACSRRGEDAEGGAAAGRSEGFRDLAPQRLGELDAEEQVEARFIEPFG